MGSPISATPRASSTCWKSPGLITIAAWTGVPAATAGTVAATASMTAAIILDLDLEMDMAFFPFPDWG
jgi:hypothetical protein